MLQLDNLTIPIWIYDIEGYRIHWANSPAIRFWESQSLEDLCARDLRPAIPEAVFESYREYQNAFAKGEVLFQYLSFPANNTDKHAFCQLSGYLLKDGRVGMLVEAIPETKLNFDATVGLTTLLSNYLMDGRFISGNQPFLNAMGREVNSLPNLISDPAVTKTLFQCLKKNQRFESDVLMKTTSGERWYHLTAINAQVAEGIEGDKILVQQHDIHQRKTSEIALHQEASSDVLTGLLNRRGLERRLKELEENQQDFFIYYIDMDGFKLINDSFGHATGDYVLQAVATRLKEIMPANSFACRFGGDEFIIGVVSSNRNIDEEFFADSLVSSLSDSYSDGLSNVMTLSASVGLARYPKDVNRFSDVVRCADAAMYKAKQSGKRRWAKYEPGIEQSMHRQSIIAQYLYTAEEKSELALHYQPIWDFSESARGKIVSFEALLRWHNPELGWVQAEELVKTAEQIGVIDHIERWVVSQALSDLMILRDLIGEDVTMAINISAVHLRVPKLPEFLLGMIEESQLKPSDLTIELTESTLIEDIDKDDSVVRQLVSKGLNISIDDFGTGYSSLAYLHHIPAKTVKIDRSFVNNIEYNDRTIKHIHKLIETYGMRALIEGVETRQQKEKLTSLGIFHQQGYLLGKPKPISFYSKYQKYFRPVEAIHAKA
jgi:diguanylate cyclase (GGDEF)-like protein